MNHYAGLWWDNESLLTPTPIFPEAGFQQKISAFVAVGKEGKTMETDGGRLGEIVKKDTRRNISVGFHYFADENHATAELLVMYVNLPRCGFQANTLRIFSIQ